tara:strand:- start:260 stop:394 length:135 start_codon:yes stop_codon:yes gene_type:complete
MTAGVSGGTTRNSSRGRKMGRFFLKGAAKCPAVQKEGEQREQRD